MKKKNNILVTNKDTSITKLSTDLSCRGPKVRTVYCTRMYYIHHCTVYICSDRDKTFPQSLAPEAENCLINITCILWPALYFVFHLLSLTSQISWNVKEFSPIFLAVSLAPGFLAGVPCMIGGKLCGLIV